MKTSEHVNELFAALSKAQGEIRGAVKDSANPFFKSSYADLASVWEACREPLAKHGLCVVQFPRSDGPTVVVETRIGHSSGQWLEGELTAHAKDDGPQAIGSAITYLRRYSLQSVTGVAPEDDDGEAATDRNRRPNPKKAEVDRIAAEHGMKTADKLPEKKIARDPEGNFDPVGYYRKKFAIENTDDGLDAAVRELKANKEVVGGEYKPLLVEWFQRAVEVAGSNERVKALDGLLAKAKEAIGDDAFVKVGLR
jgi:ERF superfamily protein